MSQRNVTNRLNVEKEVKADDEAREKFVSRSTTMDGMTHLTSTWLLIRTPYQRRWR